LRTRNGKNIPKKQKVRFFVIEIYLFSVHAANIDNGPGVMNVQMLESLTNSLPYTTGIILSNPSTYNKAIANHLCELTWDIAGGQKQFLDFEFKGHGIMYCKNITGTDGDVLAQAITEHHYSEVRKKCLKCGRKYIKHHTKCNKKQNGAFAP
jgi:hypothetical protein